MSYIMIKPDLHALNCALANFYGYTDGHFIHPYGIALSSKGNIYVSDINNTRIQIF